MKSILLSVLILLVFCFDMLGQAPPPFKRTALTTNDASGTPNSGQSPVFNSDGTWHYVTGGDSSSNVVNVLDFGAVGDGITDNTTAFQNAVNAITNTGGIIDVPAGDFFVDGPFFLPSRAKDLGVYCQIALPVRNLSTEPIVSIWFRGVQKPTLNTIWTTNALPIASQQGSIIRSTRVPASPLYTIIGGAGPTNSIYDHTAVYVRFDNIILRTYDNPKTTAANLSYIAQAVVDDCVIDTGTGGGAQSEPTNLGRGLITPTINNWVISEVRNTDVRGYFRGYVLNEHSDVDDCRVWLCSEGWHFPGGTHSIRIGHTVTTGCTRGVTGGPAGGFVQRITWENYAVEHSILGNNIVVGSSTWANSVADFDDTNSVLKGLVHFAPVQSGVGATNQFIVNNTTNVTFYSMDEHAYYGLKVRPRGTNDAFTLPLFQAIRANGTHIVTIGQYPQPFEWLTGIWLGPGALLTPETIATNFAILSDGTNNLTINSPQPPGGTAANSRISFQVGHVTKAIMSNDVFTSSIPYNFGSASQQFVSGVINVNNSKGPIIVIGVVQLTSAAVTGSVAMQLRIVGSITNSIGWSTSAAIPAQAGDFRQLIGIVPAGASWGFTNTSTGAGNGTTLFLSQVLTF